MRNTTKLVLATGLLTASSMAAAEIELSGNVTMATDYVYRGISQTDEDPAIQGGFDLGHSSGFYLGIWGSNVDFNDGDEAHIEVDIYAGVGGGSGAWSWDVGFIHYDYPGADSSLNYDFDELYGSVGYDFGAASVTAGVAFSSDFFGSSGDSRYYTLDVDIPLPADFGLNLHYGNQDIDDNGAFGTPDYDEYKISLSKSVGGFDLALDYTDTDLSETECFGGTDLCDSRVVFSVSKSL